MTPTDRKAPELRFLTTIGEGGPHDYDSYVAGWQMGALDAAIATIRRSAPLRGLSIEVVNRPQAEWIAQRHGWTVSFEDSSDDGWLIMNLSPTC